MRGLVDLAVETLSDNVGDLLGLVVLYLRGLLDLTLLDLLLNHLLDNGLNGLLLWLSRLDLLLNHLIDDLLLLIQLRKGLNLGSAFGVVVKDDLLLAWRNVLGRADLLLRFTVSEINLASPDALLRLLINIDGLSLRVSNDLLDYSLFCWRSESYDRLRSDSAVHANTASTYIVIVNYLNLTASNLLLLMLLDGLLVINKHRSICYIDGLVIEVYIGCSHSC